jgi:hypothetical protein
MNEIMEKFNYKEGYYPNEWMKKNWTVRFALNKVEAYDTPRLNIPGMYYCKDLNEVNMEELLTEIEQYIK